MSNPFERLRSLARWSGDDDQLAGEAALAIAGLAGDPGMVVACRRMLAHHPANARLWWLLAHVLAAPEPRLAARQCMDRLDADPTATHLAASLEIQDEGARLGIVGWNRTVDLAMSERFDLDVVAIAVEGDDPTSLLRRRTTDRNVRVVEPWECAAAGVDHLLVVAVALDDCGALVPRGVADLLWEVGDDVDLWLVGGVGTVLPHALVAAMLDAIADTESDHPVALERLEFGRVTKVVGLRGAEPPDEAIGGFTCPLPAELLRPL